MLPFSKNAHWNMYCKHIRTPRSTRIPSTCKFFFFFVSYFVLIYHLDLSSTLEASQIQYHRLLPYHIDTYDCA